MFNGFKNTHDFEDMRFSMNIINFTSLTSPDAGIYERKQEKTPTIKKKKKTRSKDLKSCEKN